MYFTDYKSEISKKASKVIFCVINRNLDISITHSILKNTHA